MAFVLNPTRKFTVKYTTPRPKDIPKNQIWEGESFEADFEFMLTEDCFTEDLRKRVKGLEPILDGDTEEIKTDKLYKQQSVIWYKIRNSLKAVRGIEDTQGNPLNICNEDGSINIEMQAATFEFITNFGEVSSQILTAYLGLNIKNLKAGVTKS